MLLKTLLPKLCGVRIYGESDCEIERVTENSNSASERTVFVALRGSKFDGVNFIDEARRRGAKVFVVERNIPKKKNEVVIFSKNARKTMAEISNALFGAELGKMKIIGITGTKGKTTTLKILSECINSRKIPLVSIGTLGVEFYGERHDYVSTENTTPNAPFIYETLSLAYKRGIRVALIEVSSQALVTYRVYGIPFTVCIFTNISPDHIGAYEHKSFKEYVEAKRSLFVDYSPELIIANTADPLWENVTSGCERVIKVGEKNCDFNYEPIYVSDACVEFYLNGENFKLSLGGSYNGINASLALSAASLILGVDISEFKNCLRLIKIPGRYEVYFLKEKKIIIDFAHNERSFSAICESVRKNTAGKLTVVFGSVGDRCQNRRRELAKIAEKYADIAVITADNPGFEPVERISLEIYSHFTDKSKAVMISDRERAIHYAVSHAKANDSILLLGKGQENYQLIGNKRIPFSERDIVKRLGAKEMG